MSRLPGDFDTGKSLATARNASTGPDVSAGVYAGMRSRISTDIGARISALILGGALRRRIGRGWMHDIIGRGIACAAGIG